MIERALSIRQPWAWLIVHGTKRVENRRWDTRFRGPLLIHASKGMTVAEYRAARDYVADISPAIVVPPMHSLERGGIIGRAELVAVVPPCHGDTFHHECGHAWHADDQFGFVLDRVEPLPFRAYVGSLGFFAVTP